MPRYRRAHVPGGSFFFTLVTHGRWPLFRDETTVDRLRAAFRQVNADLPFIIDAAVILPDHLHLIMTLPGNDADFSTRIARIKLLFTRSTPLTSSEQKRLSPSQLRRNERAVWQKRFWEHTIRSEDEFSACADYIHYNPVKHGYVSCPHEWPHSSFRRCVERKWYDADWACVCHGEANPPPDLSAVEKIAGE